MPAVSGTSRLSPHLRFGTIGIRRLLAEARAAWKDADAPGRASIDVFVSELAWREFYASILAEHPRVLTESFRPEFERFPWAGGEDAEERFAAWRDGDARAAHAGEQAKPVSSGADLLEFEVVMDVKPSI